ncbi:DEAD/DEAH box helicase [Tessaracoccus sp. MC1865]|uniref:DEAD/DEAH box helicase n=1 Tax=Tessaracoccus sp. MC1865 TaxID=2760310 RepID=UPI0016036A97|nr:DEAD/DEAH box helicase [Tessaracoccus sp. MC1865]MBB1483495.1 DEAD/DEAH box helicase [Tessaracoccus sp. MC1865]QTO36592.1 DEAD/DEAH box helicase [Tessaracoccus sp. MC1865]
MTDNVLDQLSEFSALYPYQLDDYQLDGCRELAEGRGVLVAAPTGAGKTVVGEFAVFLAVETSRKCFYTTPIKALSNQKYHDLVERYGSDRVGLLTGDTSINSEAQIVVMTTEVLRNMIYAGSPTLANLGFVVMDEVHYLADRFRGAVWEEVILGLSDSVQIVALSATVSNVEDFGEWLRTVRGEFSIVVSERRPVPLFQHVLVGRKLMDLFEGVAPTAQELPEARASKVNRELLRVSKGEATKVRDDARRPRGRSGRGKREVTQGSGRYGGAAHERFREHRTSRGEVAVVLDRAQLLPGICFIFSRVGCDAAVGQVFDAGITLTNRSEAALLGDIADKHVKGLSWADLDALGYDRFREALMAGVAAHHAGQLPAYKAIVEEGFATGALKLVFATETLALGINMPARTVIIEKLVKYNGESHVDITPGEYTQLTGRAGRRGIDVEGHAVVLWQSGMDPRAVAGLASRRTYPLVSSFAPTYNMAVNLMATLGRERASDLLNQSFAQFQTDKSVVKATRTSRSTRADLVVAREAVECHLGDFMSYARLRDEISRLEAVSSKARKAEQSELVGHSLTTLMPGDIVHVPRQGWSVVLRVGQQGRQAEPWAQIISGDHTVLKLQAHDLRGPVQPVGRVRVPRNFSVRDRADRRSLLSAMSSKIASADPEIPDTAPPSDDQVQREIRQLRGELKAHPCHECPDREIHAVEAARVIRLEREAERIESQITGRANSLAVQFERVLAVLEELGYLDDDSLTDAGRMLRRIYNELDLVAAECIRRDVFAGLTPPQLAAVLSTLVYESRPTRDAVLPRMPDAESERAQSALRDVWREVGRLERQHKRDRGREPDIGFAEAAWRWSSGQDLSKVLATTSLSAGDFVRWVRQVVDLAGQLATAVGPGDLRRTCHAVADSMRRGVVATDLTED